MILNIKYLNKFTLGVVAACFPIAGVFATSFICDEPQEYAYFVHPTDLFSNVVEQACQDLETDTIQVRWTGNGHYVVSPMEKKLRATPRNYNTAPSSADVEDISYILTTLANSTLPKIKSAESSLKRAGDRIDHVHPLRFLQVVFSNEELKVAIRNLEGRSWVWKSFLDGITETLAEENGRNNIAPYLQQFCSVVNVNLQLMQPIQQQGKWERFVTTLISVIPRAEGGGRYNQ